MWKSDREHVVQPIVSFGEQLVVEIITYIIGKYFVICNLEITCTAILNATYLA